MADRDRMRIHEGVRVLDGVRQIPPLPVEERTRPAGGGFRARRLRGPRVRAHVVVRSSNPGRFAHTTTPRASFMYTGIATSESISCRPRIPIAGASSRTISSLSRPSANAAPPSYRRGRCGPAVAPVERPSPSASRFDRTAHTRLGRRVATSSDELVQVTGSSAGAVRAEHCSAARASTPLGLRLSRSAT